MKSFRTGDWFRISDSYKNAKNLDFYRCILLPKNDCFREVEASLFGWADEVQGFCGPCRTRCCKRQIFPCSIRWIRSQIAPAGYRFACCNARSRECCAPRSPFPKAGAQFGFRTEALQLRLLPACYIPHIIKCIIRLIMSYNHNFEKLIYNSCAHWQYCGSFFPMFYEHLMTP